jgi:hypothetical protein
MQPQFVDYGELLFKHDLVFNSLQKYQIIGTADPMRDRSRPAPWQRTWQILVRRVGRQLVTRNE